MEKNSHQLEQNKGNVGVMPNEKNNEQSNKVSDTALEAEDYDDEDFESFEIDTSSNNVETSSLDQFPNDNISSKKDTDDESVFDETNVRKEIPTESIVSPEPEVQLEPGLEEVDGKELDELYPGMSPRNTQVGSKMQPSQQNISESSLNNKSNSIDVSKLRCDSLNPYISPRNADNVGGDDTGNVDETEGGDEQEEYESYYDDNDDDIDDLILNSMNHNESKGNNDDIETSQEKGKRKLSFQDDKEKDKEKNQQIPKQQQQLVDDNNDDEDEGDEGDEGEENKEEEESFEDIAGMDLEAYMTTHMPAADPIPSMNLQVDDDDDEEEGEGEEGGISGTGTSPKKKGGTGSPLKSGHGHIDPMFRPLDGLSPGPGQSRLNYCMSPSEDSLSHSMQQRRQRGGGGEVEEDVFPPPPDDVDIDNDTINLVHSKPLNYDYEDEPSPRAAVISPTTAERKRIQRIKLQLEAEEQELLLQQQEYDAFENDVKNKKKNAFLTTTTDGDSSLTSPKGKPKTDNLIPNKPPINNGHGHGNSNSSEVSSTFEGLGNYQRKSPTKSGYQKSLETEDSNYNHNPPKQSAGSNGKPPIVPREALDNIIQQMANVQNQLEHLVSYDHLPQPITQPDATSNSSLYSSASAASAAMGSNKVAVEALLHGIDLHSIASSSSSKSKVSRKTHAALYGAPIHHQPNHSKVQVRSRLNFAIAAGSAAASNNNPSSGVNNKDKDMDNDIDSCASNSSLRDRDRASSSPSSMAGRSAQTNSPRDNGSWLGAEGGRGRVASLEDQILALRRELRKKDERLLQTEEQSAVLASACIDFKKQVTSLQKIIRTTEAEILSKEMRQKDAQHIPRRKSGPPVAGIESSSTAPSIRNEAYLPKSGPTNKKGGGGGSGGNPANKGRILALEERCEHLSKSLQESRQREQDLELQIVAISEHNDSLTSQLKQSLMRELRLRSTKTKLDKAYGGGSAGMGPLSKAAAMKSHDVNYTSNNNNGVATAPPAITVATTTGGGGGSSSDRQNKPSMKPPLTDVNNNKGLPKKGVTITTNNNGGGGGMFNKKITDARDGVELQTNKDTARKGNGKDKNNNRKSREGSARGDSARDTVTSSLLPLLSDRK